MASFFDIFGGAIKTFDDKYNAPKTNTTAAPKVTTSATVNKPSTVASGLLSSQATVPTAAPATTQKATTPTATTRSVTSKAPQYGGSFNTKQDWNDYGNWLIKNRTGDDGVQAAQEYYDKGKELGYSGAMLDDAMGWDQGTTDNYASVTNQDTLSGVNYLSSPANAYNPNRDYMANAAQDNEIKSLSDWYINKANWNGTDPADNIKDLYSYGQNAGVTAAQMNRALGGEGNGNTQAWADANQLEQLTGVPAGTVDLQHGMTREKLNEYAAHIQAQDATPEQKQQAIYNLYRGLGITGTESDQMMGLGYGTTHNGMKAATDYGLLNGRAQDDWNLDKWEQSINWGEAPLPAAPNNGGGYFSGGPSNIPSTGGNIPPIVNPGTTNPGTTTPGGNLGDSSLPDHIVNPPHAADLTNMDAGLLNNIGGAVDVGSANRYNQYQDLLYAGQGLKGLNQVDHARMYSDRLAEITDEGSPLMDRAETYAKQEMAKRGLLNSSIGIGAAQAALIDQASKIAAGDVDVDKFNVGETNDMQTSEMNNATTLTNTTLNNLSDTYGRTQGAANDMLTAENQHRLDMAKDKEQASLEMERDMLGFTNERAIEMLKQQSGLYAQYLNAYSGIAGSDIPATQKDAQLKNLAANIDAAVNAANRYADLEITNSPGGFSFNPVNVSNNAAIQGSNNDSALSLTDQNYQAAEALMTEMHGIYRVGGGQDSPQETTIENWRNAMGAIKQHPASYERVMAIYNEYGMNNENWEDTAKAMIAEANRELQFINSNTAPTGDQALINAMNEYG